MNYGIIDSLIIIVYLSFTIYFGLRAKKYVENSDGYFVAGRKVRLSLGIATLVATEIGTVTFMYFSELGYVSGYSSFFIGLIGVLGFLIIGKTGFIIVGLRKLRIMTIPEFYEIKYNKNVRFLGGIILFLSGVLNMGIFLKFDALFLSETMGLGSSVLVIIMTVMLIIVVLYTILGGMFSVVVTDYMQFVIVSVGMLVTTIFVLLNVNLADMSDKVGQYYGSGGYNTLENVRFGWTFVLWMLLATITTSGLNQPVAAKSFASETPEVGRKVFLFYGLTVAGRSIIPMFWGIAALVIFGPHLNSTIAMPKMIGAIVPTGFLGIVIAGMLAASMSTYSAYLLSWSSVAARDIISPLKIEKMSEERIMFITKIISAIIGIFILVFGLYYELPATAFQYLMITGAMYMSGAFSCIAGGLYWKKANIIGAYSALSLGAVMPIIFLILDKFKYILPQYLYFLVDINVSGFLSMLLPVGGMIAGSLLTQKSHPPFKLVIKETESK